MNPNTIISDDMVALLGRSSGNVYLHSASASATITITPAEAHKLLAFLTEYCTEHPELDPAST